MSGSRVNSVRRMESKPKKKHWFKFMFTLTIVVFGIVLLMLSPVFDIGDVKITGNSKVSAAAIKQQAGLNDPVNIFSINSNKMEASINGIPYIKSARITKVYPNSLLIEVVERKVRGYINYKEMDTYILIDEDGMALETKTYIDQQLPIIVGLEFENFSVGEIIKTDNKNAFKTVMTLSNLFEKYGFDYVNKIDVSDINAIHIYIDNVDVLFGDMAEADRKLQDLKGLIDSGKVPNGARSVLDMNTSQYVFRFLK